MFDLSKDVQLSIEEHKMTETIHQLRRLQNIVDNIRQIGLMQIVSTKSNDQYNLSLKFKDMPFTSNSSDIPKLFDHVGEFVISENSTSNITALLAKINNKK